jgi:hypothetical protein
VLARLRNPIVVTELQISSADAAPAVTSSPRTPRALVWDPADSIVAVPEVLVGHDAPVTAKILGAVIITLYIGGATHETLHRGAEMAVASRGPVECQRHSRPLDRPGGFTRKASS